MARSPMPTNYLIESLFTGYAEMRDPETWLVREKIFQSLTCRNKGDHKIKLAGDSLSQKEIRKGPYDFPTFRPEFPIYSIKLGEFRHATLPNPTSGPQNHNYFK
ncbi:hypothetical protein TcasGA2_TC004890 [Tribolium castaneum]|uniref:Uncharacterized protein n=1 Tax=Tribolium castaneum TaxID=7070 RepID=D6WCG3_TRICA|nr:hypothetical protein TcasGA2_TC004890 [Tribolium castaneum]